jgi:hypothetical protein
MWWEKKRKTMTNPVDIGILGGETGFWPLIKWPGLCILFMSGE